MWEWILSIALAASPTLGGVAVYQPISSNLPHTDTYLVANIGLEAPIIVQDESLPLETVFSTSSLIYELWGKEEGDLMMLIADCESWQRQFDSNGKVVTSHTRDFGYFQINEKTWDVKAKELGLDYKGSLVDNILMAKHVWDVQSKTAWVCYPMVI